MERRELRAAPIHAHVRARLLSDTKTRCRHQDTLNGYVNLMK